MYLKLLLYLILILLPFNFFATYSANVRGRLTIEKAQLDLAINHLFKKKAKYRRAFEELERFKNSFPYSIFKPRAIYYSAKVLRRLGKFEQAIKEYKKITDKTEEQTTLTPMI